MDTVMSHDYRLLMGKISMDLSFAEKFQAYRKAIDLKTCDCDSCCNGGEAKGNCSECFASCCQQYIKSKEVMEREVAIMQAPFLLCTPWVYSNGCKF